MASMTDTLTLDEHRTALTGHCYRMLGSLVEAEDAVQEAMLKAWRNRDSFRGQSSPRTWLYRIATNVCLDSLASAERRRVRPIDTTQTPAVVDAEMALPQQPREHWVEPIPDTMALPADQDTDPAEYTILRESVRLAFVAALQYLPPRQRAALLLTQVLGWSAADAAETLEMTLPSVNSALQRARATLAARNPAVVPRVLSTEQQQLLERYLAAFEAYDVQALTTLLHEEVTLSMPPFDLWLQGHDAVATWFLGHGAGCRGSVLVPVTACGGTPAFAQYRDGGRSAWALILLDIDQSSITSMTSYLDVQTLFPRFGLPLVHSS
jgi:RNA polymerase sigma-70 factor (ECF subfamily)